MDTYEVGKRLVQLMREGKSRQAIEELYADDAEHVEAMQGPPEHEAMKKGKKGILTGDEWWEKNVEVHDSAVGDPRPNGDRFACEMMIDVTMKEGPTAGQRTKMTETCVYTVKNGKIVKGEFFYEPMSC